MSKICILGGGFAGLYTALNLVNLSWESNELPQIILVDQNDHFLFAPLLYELVTGEMDRWEIAPPYIELLANTPIRFIQAVVNEIKLDQQEVLLSNGVTLSYDRLVLALGGETPNHIVTGSAEYAIPFRSINDAYQLENKLRLLSESELDKIRIAIAGAGYTGVELACNLSDRLGSRARIRLIERGDQILARATEFNRESAKTALEDKGIWIDLETTIEKITPNTISVYYKGQIDEIAVELVIWTVGLVVPRIIKRLELKQNQRGQVITNSMLQVVDHPHIFALGDIAFCLDADGQEVPVTAQSAFQQAQFAAWNIWGSLTKRPLLPFRYQPLGEMMTLGVSDATLTSLGVKLTGPLANLTRRLAYLYRMPTFEHQLKVGFHWISRPFINLFR